MEHVKDIEKQNRQSKRWLWGVLVGSCGALLFHVVFHGVQHKPITAFALIVSDVFVVGWVLVTMQWQKAAFAWQKLYIGRRDLNERDGARNASVAPASNDDCMMTREFHLGAPEVVTACIRYVTDKHLPVGNIYNVECKLRSDTFEAVVVATRGDRRPDQQVEVMYTTPTAEELKKALTKRDGKAN